MAHACVGLAINCMHFPKSIGTKLMRDNGATCITLLHIEPRVNECAHTHTHQLITRIISHIDAWFVPIRCRRRRRRPLTRPIRFIIRAIMCRRTDRASHIFHVQQYDNNPKSGFVHISFEHVIRMLPLSRASHPALT